MKENKTLKNRYQKICVEVREKLIPEIKEFVRNNGVPKGNKGDLAVTIDIDVREYLDVPMVCVETDRHTGDCGWEQIDSIQLCKASNTLYFETTSNSINELELTCADIIDIQDFLYIIDSGQVKGFDVVDGEIRPVEESDDES